MAFKQLYYTSCETGLAGYGGYQFNAVTPGTSPLVMREIEDRSVYEPPRWLLAEPCLDEPEAYPIALSYARSEATGAAIVTQVVFAGTDYSGRPGNYFAHALVTESREPDYGSVLPAELWGAELWHRTPIESSELPELRGPLPRGVVNRAGVQAFLDARGTERVLPELLTAVWRAMAGDRLVLLASNEPNENIWWIAAVSYLLGPQLAPEMAFTTYSHRPSYARHHLIGIQGDAMPPDADSSFQLFDLDAGKTPGGTPHPLATLLAETGVTAAEELWQRAAAFSCGTEQGPDGWLGPVAVAAGQIRGQLSADETALIVGWLPEAVSQLSAQPVRDALVVVLSQPAAVLTDKQLVILLDVARRLQSPADAQRLEQALAERAVIRIGRGEPAEPVRLSPGAAQTARAKVSGLLRTAPPPVVLAALGWAGASGAMPEAADLGRYGQDGLDPMTAEAELTRLLSSYPAIRRGFLTRLALQPPRQASRVLAGPAGALISDDDLAPLPGLAEEMLLVAVEQRRQQPLHAFHRIEDIRRGTEGAPPVGVDELARLWPAGCPPEQLVVVLGLMVDSPDPQVSSWFVRQIEAAHQRGPSGPGWLTLAQALSDPAFQRLLPGRLAELVHGTATAEQKRRRANSAVDKGDMGIFASLYTDYKAADSRARRKQADHLAELLCRAEPLAVALRGCPPGVMEAFRANLRDGLGTKRHAYLAARVFTAFADQDLPGELRDQLAEDLELVRRWRRSDLGHVGRFLAHDPQIARQFQDWRASQRSGLVRKLLGGWSGPDEGR
jgi:hypothetical protein